MSTNHDTPALRAAVGNLADAFDQARQPTFREARHERDELPPDALEDVDGNRKRGADLLAAALEGEMNKDRPRPGGRPGDTAG